MEIRELTNLKDFYSSGLWILLLRMRDTKFSLEKVDLVRRRIS